MDIMVSSIEDVTVVDSGAYDCGVCKCPLKPPIYQCTVGHLVCSECREKMAAAETCHMCRHTLSGGCKRCFGVEHIVEGLRVPCANKDYATDLSASHGLSFREGCFGFVVPKSAQPLDMDTVNVAFK